MAGSPPLELSVEEFLARLKLDRRATLRALHQRPWRLTSFPVAPSDFWDLFDETVREDGAVDLSAFAGRADAPLSFTPEVLGAASAVVAMCLSAYAASDEISVTMETARDGAVTIRASTSPAANNERKEC
mgnify:CR=1 FL=1